MCSVQGYMYYMQYLRNWLFLSECLVYQVYQHQMSNYALQGSVFSQYHTGTCTLHLVAYYDTFQGRPLHYMYPNRSEQTSKYPNRKCAHLKYSVMCLKKKRYTYSTYPILHVYVAILIKVVPEKIYNCTKDDRHIIIHLHLNQLVCYKKKRRVTQTGVEPAHLLLGGNALNNLLQCRVARDDKMPTHQNRKFYTFYLHYQHSTVCICTKVILIRLYCYSHYQAHLEFKPTSFLTSKSCRVTVEYTCTGLVF